MYSLQRTVDPTAEPVTLDQVKAQCRLDPEDYSQDALLSLYIRAAREHVENETGRALLTQTWVLTRDSFPGSAFGSPGSSPPSALSVMDSLLNRGLNWPGYTVPSLPLPRGRVQSITSVQYFDSGNQQQTMNSSLYIADTASVPARIMPALSQWWPYTAWRTGAVQVTYVAGYGSTATSVPGALCLACLLLVGHWYENREATQAALTGNGPMPLPLGVADLLAPYIDLTLTYES